METILLPTAHDSPRNPPLLGTVLVTGGCGFLGYHLVGQLLADPACGPVYVLDPSSSSSSLNTHPGATYLRGSVADPPAALAAVLAAVRPRVVFHAASPNATYSPRAAFHAVNVGGTRTLLELLATAPAAQDQDRADDDDHTPRALVYTSSLDVYADPPHRRVAEDHPLLPEHPPFWAGVSEYNRTKAVAHRLVLAANDPAGLRTAVIVPAHIWGVRDSQALSLLFDTFADPRAPQWQVGSGTNVVSQVEAGNCAAAHILVAKRLVACSSSSGKDDDARVDGQAFNVTDGADVNFWADVRAWRALITRKAEEEDGQGQQQQQQQKTYVIPAWAMGVVVAVAGWLYLVLTLGRAEPPAALGRNSLSWCTEDHTLDDSKARERLGYRPRDIDEDRLRAEAVEWERERRRMAAGEKDD